MRKLRILFISVGKYKRLHWVRKCVSLLWEDRSTTLPEKTDSEVGTAAENTSLFCGSVSFSGVTARHSRALWNCLRSSKTGIYCFIATPLIVWLGCLVLRPVLFSFWLACELHFYYCPGYSYGGHQNVWDDCKFWAVPGSLSALCCVLVGGIASLGVKIMKWELLSALGEKRGYTGSSIGIIYMHHKSPVGRDSKVCVCSFLSGSNFGH